MAVFADPRFRRLLAAQTLSTFGDSALYLTLGIWAKDLTGSNAAAGLVFLCLAAPSLLGPMVGHLVDRLSRRTVLIVNNLATGTLVLALLAVHSRSQLWVIYAVTLGYGCSFTVLSAARNGLIKDMLPASDLGTANAAFQTVFQGVRLFSPLAGAGLYTVSGGATVAVLDAATFAVAALVLWTIRLTESAPEPRGEEPYLRQVAAGFVHIRRTPVLAQILVAAGLAFCTIGFTETVIFALVDEGLHRSPAFVGVLECVQGGGAILGGLTASRVLRRAGEARAVGLALAMLGGGVAVVIVPSLWAVLPGIFLAGAGIPWGSVALVTALQRYTPARLVGRTAASANLMLDLPQTTSIALGAALIAVVDYRVLLAVIAVAMAASASYLLIRPAPAPQPDSSARVPAPA